MPVQTEEVLVKATPLRTIFAYMAKELPPAANRNVTEKAAAEFPSNAATITERRVIASDRVPVRLVNRLLELIAEERHERPTMVAHRVGRLAAEEAANGILRLALTMISVPNLLRKLIPVWSQLYTHGEVSSRCEARTATIELKNFPLVSATGCARVTGWFEWFAERAERTASVHHDSCTARGESLCRWIIQW